MKNKKNTKKLKKLAYGDRSIKPINPSEEMYKNNLAMDQAIAMGNLQFGGAEAIGQGIIGVGGMIDAMQFPEKENNTTKTKLGQGESGGGEYDFELAFGGKVGKKKLLKYGGGGQVPVEVEGGEAAETPNGDNIEFEGPSHNEGGIPIVLPKGTTVYSDRISLDGKTLADRKKIRERRINKVSKALEKNPKDSLLSNMLERIGVINEMEEHQDLQIQASVAAVKENQPLGKKTKAKWGVQKLGLGIDGLEKDKKEPTTNDILKEASKISESQQKYSTYAVDIPSEYPNYVKDDFGENTESKPKLDPNRFIGDPFSINDKKDDYLLKQEAYRVANNIPRKPVTDGNGFDFKLNGDSKFPELGEGVGLGFGFKNSKTFEAPTQKLWKTDIKQVPIDNEKRGGKDVSKPYVLQNNQLNLSNNNSSINEKNSDGSLSYYKPDVVAKTKKPNIFKKAISSIGENNTIGDVLGIASNISQGITPLLQTMKNRAGDILNPNFYENYGQEALNNYDSEMKYVGQQRDNNNSDLELARNASVVRNNNSARSVNTRNALNLAADQVLNRSKNDIYNKATAQMSDISNRKSQTQLNIDGVRAGAKDRQDIANRQDRDNFNTQHNKDLLSLAQSFGQTGKSLNDIKERNVTQRVSQDAFTNFAYSANGKPVYKKGGKFYNDQKQEVPASQVTKEKVEEDDDKLMSFLKAAYKTFNK